MPKCHLPHDPTSHQHQTGGGAPPLFDRATGSWDPTPPPAALTHEIARATRGGSLEKKSAIE
eukprot:scaffold2639_cov95-Isochrysis_galbana.AAC.14